VTQRWARLLLGAACTALGVALTLRPFTSLAVLVVLVAASFFVTGIGELASSGRADAPLLAVAAGLGWIAAGAAVLVWAGSTIHALAIVAGISMVLGGFARLTAAVRAQGADRTVAALTGLASAVFGVLALSWPDLTVLVLALLVGARTVIFGLQQIAAAARPRPDRPGRRPGRRSPQWLRVAGAVVSMALALGLLAVSAVIHGSSASPDAFYVPSSIFTARTVLLLLFKTFSVVFAVELFGWRLLYSGKGAQGVPDRV
jgi:uncharacterized membrane protein HdeD (DUF308 family)